MVEEKKELGFIKKLSLIPCFRDSYFYGICSGFVGGLSYFMFTSKVGMSTHFGFGTFVVTTLSYWGYCRYNYSEAIRKNRFLQDYMNNYLEEESAESPPAVEEPVKFENA